VVANTTQAVRGGGGDSTAGGAGVGYGGGPTYIDVQNSRDFSQLRRRFRRFVFPMTALFLSWYFLYVILAAFASDFMSTKVAGNINIGLLFGLGQFVSTFAITMTYVRWADRRFDATADKLRQHLEGGELR
jgi:uncharacterized membrane protein (DUF485 family)